MRKTASMILTNMKQSLPEHQKQIVLKSISSCLLSHQLDVVAAYVFGSFLSEDAFSDIDIGVLVKKDIPKALDFEITLESKIEAAIGIPIDVRLLNRAPLAFCQSVFRSGRVILDRDANFRSDFEGQVLKQYFDFSRFRRRYLAEVSHAPI